MNKTTNLLKAVSDWLAIATDAAKEPFKIGCGKNLVRFNLEYPEAISEIESFKKTALENATLRNQMQALVLEKELLVEAARKLANACTNFPADSKIILELRDDLRLAIAKCVK